ncbi:MAG: hypothetical protein LBE79_00800 [Tannerella sp.]|jgi:hypothetical protein|nr:hypothetical protein [Tannerella sp.]
MKQINLFLTFDYELPLGGWTVSPESALIEPTQKILALCDKLQVHAVFFVDVLCMIRFRRLENNTFEKAVRKQLAEIVEKGHDIQLHLHPHWFTSGLENGKYQPSKDFRLADFCPHEIADMVVQGIAYLNEIAKPVNPDYSCVAFRAGGLNLENSPVFFQILSENGIRIDSSLCHGYYYASEISTVDHNNLPNQANWYFKNGKYNVPATSGIYEIPIAGKSKSVFEIPTWIKVKIHKDRMPENRGKMIHRDAQLSFRKKLRKALSARMLSFDNYTYSTRFLMRILHHNIKCFGRQPVINLAIISHPKSMDVYHYQLMEDYIVSVRKHYGNRIAFRTFHDYFQSLSS